MTAAATVLTTSYAYLFSVNVHAEETKKQEEKPAQTEQAAAAPSDGNNGEKPQPVVFEFKYVSLLIF